MDNQIKLEDGIYGKKAIIIGNWNDSYYNFFKENNVLELELNDGKGWKGDSVSFLESLFYLKSLKLIDLRIKNIDKIHNLVNLENLHLTTYSKTHINFNHFSQLKICGFEWIKNSDSLFDCIGLKYLGLNNYKNSSSSAFSKLINLEKLTIMNSNIENLKGLTNLINLNYLNISNLKKLNDITDIENLKEVKEIEIQNCKSINNVCTIFKLNKLKRLLLLNIGNIETIKGIENLKDLNDFIFYESTNILDGDLYPITKLENLKKIAFQNRRHYSHKREDFLK